MITKYLKYSLITIVLILMQKTFVPLINIFSIVPDFVFLWIVYISVREGQMTGMLLGFVFGMILDFIASSFLGLFSLTYSIGGFVAGYFYDEFKAQYLVQSYNFILIIFFSSVVCNLVFFSFYIQGNEMNFWFLLAKYGIGSSVYTVIIGTILIFILSKRKLKVTKGVVIHE